MMRSHTLIPAVVLFMSCVDPVPDGGPDDLARFTDALIRFHLETYSGTTLVSEATQLESAEEFAERLYYDCQEQNANPEVAGTSPLPRPALENCPTWDDTANAPNAASSCEQELCTALAAQCVSERLYAISREVDDYESRIYNRPGNDDDKIIVPPQSAAANATLVEVASTWAAHAMQVSGENLRSGLGVAQREPVLSGSGYDAACTNGGAQALIAGGNKLDDVLDPTNTVSWAEVFLLTLFDAAQFQADELVPAIEQTFAAVAEAEHSNNSSAAAAARYAWVEGRTSRARAAHVLLGGVREDGLFRVPDGYGSLGSLSRTEQQALQDIRVSGINPADLAGTATQIVDDVIAEIRSQNSLMPSDYGTADLLDARGLIEEDFRQAARWLDDALNVFELNRSLTLTSYPVGRFAATTTFEVVPPTLDLLVSARRGDSTHSGDVAAPSRMLEGNYPLRSASASLDYAADVSWELASVVPGLSMADLEETFAAGARTTSGLRTGRIELCSDRDTNPTGSHGYELRYAGLIQDITVVSGIDGLRCALTGTIHGADCTVAAHEWGTMQASVSEQTAGVSEVQIWTNSSVVFTPPTVYLLRTERDASEQPIAYHPIAGGHFPTPDPGSEGCELVSIVPSVDTIAARVIRPNDDTLDRAGTSCVGLPANQRLPLEDELSDDGDQFESSWRHYLNLAAQAAEEADRLGEAVLDNGLEIERRVELASANLEGVCGSAIDIDFLSALGGLGNSSNCDPPAVDGSTFESGGVGYVCQGGEAVPDALETVRARANAGDVDAAKLLECVGDASVVKWASLGSRPLCLWEDDATGAACVGAMEEGLQCPVPLTDVSCSAQLMTAIGTVTAEGHATGVLQPVTVSENLGIFADDVVPPSTSFEEELEDFSAPPCDHLRTLRSPASSEIERRAARDLLVHHPWLTLENVSAEAGRLAWEAYPYDHGMVLRDSEPFVWTGRPETGGYPSMVWPCGVPLEGELSDMGTPAGECAMTTAGSALAGPLGCAFINDCEANGATGAGASDLLNRVRMNQRIGRAAVALRLLTAEGFIGMRLPVNIIRPDEQLTDRYSFPEGSNDVLFQMPNTYADAEGVALSSNDILGLRAAEVRARDTDGIDATSTRAGAGYCVRVQPCDPGADGCTSTCGATEVGGCAINHMGYLWTRLSQGVYDGSDTTCDADCLTDNDCDNCFRIYAPCFNGFLSAFNGMRRRAPFLAMAFDREDGTPPNRAIENAVNDVWAGIGPHAASARTESVIRSTLDHFVTDEDGSGVEVPGFDEKEYLRRYWRDDSNIRLLDELTYGDVLDALELACASSRFELEDQSGVGGVSLEPCDPERLRNLETSSEADIAQMEDFLKCSANNLEENAELLTMRNVPVDVVNAVKAEFGGATIPELSGSRGVLVGEMTGDIIALRNYRLQIARVMRELASAAFTLRTDLARQGIQREQIQLQLTSQISNQITACVAAASPSISTTGGASFNPGAAIATCLNTAIQIGVAIKQARNSVSEVFLDEGQAFDNFSTTFQSLSDALSSIEIELAAAGHRLQARSAELETGRQEAQRALGQAMLFSSDGAGRQLRVNTLLRRRFTTSQDRYERARDHAMKMAYLAKLALEQRLGVRLANLREDLTLVEAPSSWESRLCTMTGIEFERVRDGDSDIESYADQYIGDYVDRLSRTAESYRLDFPFHEASDSAVISMRDVLLDVRDECPGGAPAANLLADSADLSMSTWEPTGCVPVDQGVLDPDGNTVIEPLNCIDIGEGATPTNSLSTPSMLPLGHAEGWRVRFGPQATVMLGEASARTSTRLSQEVSVDAGSYIISWYANQVPMSPIAPGDAVEVLVDGAEQTLFVSSEGTYGGTCDPINVGWCRYYSLLSLSRSSVVTVSLTPNETDMATVSSGEIIGPQAIDIGGLQLESITHYVRAGVDPGTLSPSPFVQTNDAGLSALPVCEDTDGDVFRSGWRYRCERLCATGFRTDCPEENAELACFWERSFEFTSEDTLSRRALGNTGFAVGNYNYRTDGISLNFVGTNIRSCEDDPFPSSCYGSGFVNYSVEHLGPYTVINHQGHEYSAPLFTGVIEYARGLAGERFLTNPLSSADRALIEPYRRGEFRGRPLTGMYIVRVWDDGVVNFDAIEDIQILLDYRYWTRFR